MGHAPSGSKWGLWVASSAHALYMPASDIRALEGGPLIWRVGAVILDLEDAVAPEAKGQARDNAVEAVRRGDFGSKTVVIRVNGLDTPWGVEDLAAASVARPNAILAPKISTPDDITRLRAAVGDGKAKVALWAMIETAQALIVLGDLASASAHQGLETWVVGTNDLSKELRCSLAGDRAPLWGHLGGIVAAARAFGLTVLDGVYNDLEDDEGLAAECRQGLAFGFDGKSLIHPSQLATCNRTFSPSPEELAWASAVVDAFARPENAAAGVLRVEGRMAERLHLAQAARLLALAAEAS